MKLVNVLCYDKSCKFCNLDTWECTKDEIIIGKDGCDTWREREIIIKRELNTEQPY